MRCDVVAIGTELLLGQIVDTNSSYIGEQLAASGIDSLLQVKVGDNLGRMESVLRSTLADFLTQLDPARFVRVHRSYAVNLERVVEIEPTDSGDARLRLTSGAWVPCSRRYREELQKL